MRIITISFFINSYRSKKFHIRFFRINNEYRSSTVLCNSGEKLYATVLPIEPEVCKKPSMLYMAWKTGRNEVFFSPTLENRGENVETWKICTPVLHLFRGMERGIGNSSTVVSRFAGELSRFAQYDATHGVLVSNDQQNSRVG